MTKTREDALNALNNLINNLLIEPESWENPTLERYLEAIHAWLEGDGKKNDSQPSWALIIEMFEAGKIYE